MPLSERKRHVLNSTEDVGHRAGGTTYISLDSARVEGKAGFHF